MKTFIKEILSASSTNNMRNFVISRQILIKKNAAKFYRLALIFIILRVKKTVRFHILNMFRY